MEALEYVDYGVIGEGEATVCELASALENGTDISTVDGLVYKDRDTYRLTNSRRDIEDIDSIPWPDYNGFDVDKYLDLPPAEFAGVSGKRMICMLGSRSCPFRCTFCFHTNGKKYRKRSLDDFFAELDYLISNYNIEYISLSDELFAPDLDQAKEFCERIKKYNIRWYADFRIDKVNPELLAILKDSGIGTMFFGLESADNRILKSMRKGITIEQTESVLKMVYETGIPMFGCFIFGDVEETMETARKTLDWWHAHSEYHVHLTLLKPFPGSQIYKQACKSGIISDPVKYLKDGCPQVNISKLNDAEFSEVVRQISESTKVNSLEKVELISIDPVKGRENVSGICPKCSTKNTWENVKLFAIDYINCVHCGQKFAIPFPGKIKENLERNISLLLDKYGKVAIWGMTLPAMDLLRDLKLIHNKNVFPIDISDSKRLMPLHGKQIYAPSILDKETIPVVIISVPSHGGQISCQVKENHKGVKKIIDICTLIGDSITAKEQR